MKHLLRHRDSEALVDAIVKGQPVDEDTGLGDVEAFLTEMRNEFAATPPPAPRPTLASTLDGRRPLRPASGPQPKLTFPSPRPRRRFARPAVVVFATSAVLFGGLASAGALPGPVQRRTAELTAHVGIHLPGGTDADVRSEHRIDPGADVPRTGRDDPSTTEPTVGTSPTTVPSVGPTPPSTVPAVPNLPTTPTIPALPFSPPDPGHLLDPLPQPSVGLGPVGQSPVLHPDLVP